MKLLLGIVVLLLITAAVIAIASIGIALIVREGRQHPRSSGSLGSAMLELQTLIDPAKKQVLEARHALEESEEDDESGDPPVR